MRKKITACFLSLLLFLTAGCSQQHYREEDFLGKTSWEITEKYGSFDCVSRDPDSDGLYRNARCGYTVREKRKGFLDASPEILFWIEFDGQGVAVSCEEGERPGG